MKKRLLLCAGILLLMTGCSKQDTSTVETDPASVVVQEEATSVTETEVVRVQTYEMQEGLRSALEAASDKSVAINLEKDGKQLQLCCDGTNTAVLADTGDFYYINNCIYVVTTDGVVYAAEGDYASLADIATSFFNRFKDISMYENINWQETDFGYSAVAKDGADAVFDVYINSGQVINIHLRNAGSTLNITANFEDEIELIDTSTAVSGNDEVYLILSAIAAEVISISQ